MGIEKLKSFLEDNRFLINSMVKFIIPVLILFLIVNVSIFMDILKSEDMHPRQFQRTIFYIFFWIGFSFVYFVVLFFKREKIFTVNAVIFLLLSLKVIFTSGFHSNYILGLNIPSVLFIFVPILILTAKTNRKKIISYLLVSIGFFAILLSKSVEGIFLYSFSVFLTSLFVKEKNSLLLSISVFGGFVLGIFSSNLLDLIRSKFNPYFYEQFYSIYNFYIGLFPKTYIPYSVSNVPGLWTDFIQIYIFEKFGLIFGLLIFLFPLFTVIFGLFYSCRNIQKPIGRAAFVLSIIMFLYILLTIPPIIPSMPVYTLYYPLYSFVTGYILFIMYVGLLILIKEKSLNN